MAIFQRDKDAKEAPKASTKTVDETVPTQSIPYPTGSPPDPMEAYDEAHPERSVEWVTTPPAGAAPEGTRKGK